MQRDIQDSAYAWQQQVESKERVVVGVNQFQIRESAPRGLERVDASVGERQKTKLAALRSRRDNVRVQAALASLTQIAASNDNLMPAVLEAVRAYATLGEICDCLRRVFGEYRPEETLT